MNILCKNYACKYNKKLDEGIVFKFSLVATPFEGDKCYGGCSIGPYLGWYDEEKGDIRYEGSECESRPDYKFTDVDDKDRTLDKMTCSQLNCQYCKGDEYGGSCTRVEILVDKYNDMWICKCYSLSKIRGHMDWSRLLNHDGTPKGGSIDDAYAEKMNKWAKTTRSYRTHIKQNT